MSAGPRGKFVTFDGVDGSGKSTQLRHLAAWLEQRGVTPVCTREPGGTALGERLRRVLLDARGPALAPAAELALINAARAQHVEEVIGPALARGAWVLCDRFLDATLAYQGAGRGLDPAIIRGLHRALCRDLQPDLTLLLDLDPAVALARAGARADGAGMEEARFEREGAAFLERVRAAYREIARAEAHRCALLDAAAPPEAIAATVRARVAALLEHALV